MLTLFAVFGCAKTETAPAPPAEQETVAYDTTPRSICAALPATDELGRKLPENKDVGGEREGKFVGLFYWIWHTSYATQTYVCNICDVISLYPEAATDYYHPAWGGRVLPAYWWGEPMFGYYRNTDTWVLRKHAEMLCEAGVDVIVFDCTNGTFTWDDSYPTLFEVFQRCREDGVRTPQVAFMLPFAANEDTKTSLKKLYADIYSPGRYRDLWFQWKGKPLIIAHGEVFKGAASGTLENEIYNFFTFRPNVGTYNCKNQTQRNTSWGWLEIAPQKGWYATAGGWEEVTVGVAQNWSKARGLTAMNAPGVFCRSYTDASGLSTEKGAVNRGLNFQEQWENALAIDPEFIFITGWNEWVAGRHESWQGQSNAFPDQFDQECSRDIEPMKGGHGDNYYYQMISGIRRFKGVPEGRTLVPAVETSPDGWKDLLRLNTGWWGDAESFDAYRGNALVRRCEGWGSDVNVNTCANIDITGARVRHDSENLYFLVTAGQELSPEKCTLQLFIDTDRLHSTGWEGYDFKVAFSKGRAMLYKNRDKVWEWDGYRTVESLLQGKAYAIRIPLRFLGLSGIDIEFKWMDNIPESCSGGPETFWTYGDTAPIGRFNYPYSGEL